MVGQGLLEAQDVPGECRGPIVYHRLPQRGPSRRSGEYIHSRPPVQHFPAGPLEQAKERGLIEMTKGIAFVGVDDEIDLG
jgi:hypothetical protein